MPEPTTVSHGSSFDSAFMQEGCRPALDDWRSLLAEELRQVGRERPWGQALAAVGWVHLMFFLVCQVVYTVGVRAEWPSIVLWSSEIGAVLGVMRLVAGRGWLRVAPSVALIVRVWGTFLILSFNVASFNTLMGFTLDWFKPVWCTLASFGFATMAWLFGYRLLVPAFQMYFTGLLMIRFPEWNYLIHGLSWWATLQWLGWDLNRRRARHAHAENDRAAGDVSYADAEAHSEPAAA